jgi:tetratricopeptide (TPR) repeat protein
MRLLPVAIIFCATLFAQAPQAAPQSEPSDAVKAARKLHNEGKYDEAIAAFKKIVEDGGTGAWEGHLGIGVALDLKGDYSEARKHIQMAIDTAPADSQPQALRAMAMSYAFTRDTKNAELFEKQVFDYRLGKNDLPGAAEVANELARVLLESGDVNGAEKWYKTGYETIKKKTDLEAKEKDLWDFRWHSALARIAARRGKKAEAKQHADAAKATFEKGIDPAQAVYVPYVYGYAAFYAGDYKNAITQFSKANQNDPFNLVMIAQAYEKTGNKAKAREYYQKVMQSSAHNPTNAYARPIAKEKLKS